MVGGACAFSPAPESGSLPGAWIAPPPLAPLFGTFAPLEAASSRLGDSLVFGFDSRAGELVEGGRAPEWSIRSASFRSYASLGTTRWRVGLSTGLDRPVLASTDPDRRLRWLWPQSPHVGLRLDLGPRFATRIEQGAGVVAGQARVSLPLGSGADLDLHGRRARERGILRIAVADAPSIPLAWTGERTGGRVDLRIRPGDLGEFTGTLAQEEGSPGPAEPGTLLEGTSSSTGWGLRWEPRSEGPWLEASGTHGWVRSEGLVDSGGGRRTFHDAQARSWRRSAGLGWTAPSWRSGAHAEHFVGALPASRYFEPFLSWNALDPSSWAAVRQILSDQREFVQGTVEWRRAAASACRTSTAGPLELRYGAALAWTGIDARTILRTTRMSLFGLGYDVRSDSLAGSRLRSWTLEPHLRAVLRLATFGEIGLQGHATVPLSVRRLGRQATPPPESAGAPDDPRGLWDVALSWRRAW